MLNKSFKDTMHGINDKLRQWVPVRKLPEFWIAHPIFLEEFFALSRCGHISPLLCILAKHCLVPRHPGIIINSAVLRFVVAVANTAKEMTANTGERSQVSSSRKITNNQGDGTSCDASIGIVFCFWKPDAPVPGGHQVIYQGMYIVVEILKRRLFRTWDYTGKVHVLQACTWCPAVSWDKPLKWFPMTWLCRILSMSLYY